MLSVKPRRWLRVFIAVAFLILAQVSWWTVVFFEEVNTVAELRQQKLVLEHAIDGNKEAALAKEVFHRRVMFLSESVFFVLVTFVGLFLLYRAVAFEEKARETQKNFIEVLTHESKTPLTALKLRLESVQEKWPHDPLLRKDLDSALYEVRRLISVFEKTLQLNRVERHAFSFETVCLSDVVRQVVQRLDPFFRNHAVQVSVQLEEEALVYGDLHSLQNTLQHVLENAVFYNPKEDKKVAIRVELKEEQVVLSVQDNGPGIDEGEEWKVFEKFYRGASGRRVSGTGLGLYLARTVVEAHQGMIRLTTSNDRGSYFEIQLPSLSRGT